MPLYALFCKSQKIAQHKGLIEQKKLSDPKFNKFISVVSTVFSSLYSLYFTE